MGAGATPGGCSMCVKSRSEAQVWPRDPSTTTSALRPALDRPSSRPRPAACRSGYGTRPPAGSLRRLLGAARPWACCPQAHSRGQGVRPQCAPVERARDHRRAGGRGAVGRRPVLRLAGHPRGAGWQSAVATAPWQAPLRGGRGPQSAGRSRRSRRWKRGPATAFCASSRLPGTGDVVAVPPGALRSPPGQRPGRRGAGAAGGDCCSKPRGGSAVHRPS